MRDKGLDPENRKTRSDFIQRVLNTLSALKGKGTVEKLGNGLGARWRLPAEPADHAAADAREEGLRPVDAGAVLAVGVLVVDAAHRVPGVQVVPGAGLVRMHLGALGDAGTDERAGGVLGGEHTGHGAAVALADGHDAPALAGLVDGQPAVLAILLAVLRADVAAKAGAADLRRPARAADHNALALGSHDFAEVVPRRVV